ncbi:MAG: acetoin utilization protein AcuC [Chloroflexi bacterium]|nr:acetoin utilization protein AcuC [Chloroflexota bacterium]
MRRAAFIYDEALSHHVLREDHVLRPTRLRYTYELLESYHAFDGQSSHLVPPRSATEAELISFHTQEYVSAVRDFSEGRFSVDPAQFNFSDYGDNPIFPGMFQAASLAVGASLVAAEMVAKGEVDAAFNAAGGFHHAAPGYASGFCIFNDPVIAINYLLGLGLRVAYVDIDAHHGDGVQNAFYGTDKVLTISLHESGRFLFPGSGDVSEMGSGVGRGYAVNIPLAPFTGDDIYLRAFREVVPPLVSRFTPDILVTQLGADSHYLDPLTHLRLTAQGFVQVVKELGVLCPHWVALGGGGYEMGAVPRSWTLAYGAILGRDFPDAILESYREKYGLRTLSDHQPPAIDAASRLQAQAFAQASVAAVKRDVFPLHNLAASSQ